ncbi:MAG: aminoacyl-tRNA hydrolase [Bdellovibrionaceae bacterium]|nr:aminoacyl-tRNA hydrolase [Pseudobdellovibrionaceae bacterium]
MKRFSLPREQLELSFARSSGAGGQNVNKVNSKVEARWDAVSSGLLPDDVLRRLMSRYSNRLDADGLLIVTSERHRDRERNIADCIEKLEEWVESVWEKPKPRIKTKPTKGSKRRRVEGKRRDSDKKRERTKVTVEDWD